MDLWCRMICYRIPNWDKDFENNKSRAVGDLRWVKMPNKHDSEGYRIVASSGMATYGCWSAIVQVSSKCPQRGLLMRSNGKPHDAVSLALVTGGTAKEFEAAIPILIEVGWLVSEVFSGCPAIAGQVTPHCLPSVVEVSSKCPSSDLVVPKNGREWNGKKEEKTTMPIQTAESASESSENSSCDENTSGHTRIINAPTADKKPEELVLGAENVAAKTAGSKSPKPALERALGATTAQLEDWAKSLYLKYPKKVDPKKSQGYIVRHLKGFKETPTHTEQESEFARLKVHLDGYLKSDRVKAGYLMDSTTFFNGHLQSDLEAFRDAPKNAQAPPRSRLPNVSELDGVPDLPEAYYEQNGIERPSQEREVELRNGLATIGNFGEPPI